MNNSCEPQQPVARKEALLPLVEFEEIEPQPLPESEQVWFIKTKWSFADVLTSAKHVKKRNLHCSTMFIHWTFDNRSAPLGRAFRLEGRKEGMIHLVVGLRPTARYTVSSQSSTRRETPESSVSALSKVQLSNKFNI